ncbi:MAG: P-loop NTPase [Acidimicrobiia bacterium]|nr:P-loop NTPase [Acidimicrobiia bacterium]
MEHDGNTALSSAPGPARYDVAVVDPDPRHRMKLVMQLAGSTAAASFDTVDGFLERFDEERVTVAVLGPSLANPHGLEQVARLAAGHAEVGVVLVAEELSTALLQHALRAGVRDVLTLGSGESGLHEAVDRVAGVVAGLSARPVTPEAPTAMGRLLVSFSTKGGVGKSMIATNLGVAMAKRRPGRVALVDADLQFGDVAVLLGIPPQHTVIDAAAAIHHDDPELLRTLVSEHPPSGLLVLPAPVEPSSADQVRPEEMLLVVQALQRLCDIVVVDMPPHFDDLVLALVEAADDVLLVASMDIPSVKNVKVGMQTLDLMSLAGDKLRLVLNRANAKVRLDVKEVERVLGMDAEFPVPSDIAVPQAFNRGVPVVLDNPRSGAARALELMADTLLAPAGPEEDDGSGRRRRRQRS